ncbi:hypothetical protein Q7W31_10345, partial [Streptococcus suis]|nr:hypothetical protein [Streptococcus suis]MDW8753938.1 hypothetical protein [Streptococcus suis]
MDEYIICGNATEAAL